MKNQKTDDEGVEGPQTKRQKISRNEPVTESQAAQKRVQETRAGNVVKIEGTEDIGPVEYEEHTRAPLGQEESRDGEVEVPPKSSPPDSDGKQKNLRRSGRNHPALVLSKEDRSYDTAVDSQPSSPEKSDECVVQVPKARAPEKVAAKTKSSGKPGAAKSLGGTVEQDNTWLQANNAQLEVEVEVLVGKVVVLTAEKQEQQAQEKARQKEVEDLRNENQKLRVSNLKMSAKQGMELEDDDAARAKLKKMAIGCKNWSRDFCVKSWDDVEISMHTKIRHYLTRKHSARAANRATGIISKPMWKQGPYILLNTLLAQMIAVQFFRRPFFFLEKGISTDANQIAIERSLRAVFDWLLERDEAKAHQWQSQTNQLITLADSQDPGDDEGEYLHSVHALKEGFYKRSTLLFLKGTMTGTLMASADERVVEKRHDKLLEIIRNAGNLSCSLHAHKAQVVVQDKHFYDMPFKIGANEMEPHATHRLDDDDESLDGREIALVVQPGIFLYGNEHGENYDEYRVLLESTVWIAPEVKKAKK